MLLWLSCAFPSRHAARNHSHLHVQLKTPDGINCKKALVTSPLTGLIQRLYCSQSFCVFFLSSFLHTCLEIKFFRLAVTCDWKNLLETHRCVTLSNSTCFVFFNQGVGMQVKRGVPSGAKFQTAVRIREKERDVWDTSIWK